MTNVPIKPAVSDQTVAFPKQYFDLASILPSFHEKLSFYESLLAAMFDGNIEPWLKEEKIKAIVTAAVARITSKYPGKVIPVVI